MDRYFLKQHAVDAVVANLLRLVAHGCANTADVIAHIAEIDDRDYYAEVGYRSMHAWCVGVLHFSDDAAYKRITAARLHSSFRCSSTRWRTVGCISLR